MEPFYAKWLTFPVKICSQAFSTYRIFAMSSLNVQLSAMARHGQAKDGTVPQIWPSFLNPNRGASAVTPRPLSSFISVFAWCQSSHLFPPKKKKNWKLFSCLIRTLIFCQKWLFDFVFSLDAEPRMSKLEPAAKASAHVDSTGYVNVCLEHSTFECWMLKTSDLVLLWFSSLVISEKKPKTFVTAPPMQWQKAVWQLTSMKPLEALAPMAQWHLSSQREPLWPLTTQFFPRWVCGGWIWGRRDLTASPIGRWYCFFFFFFPGTPVAGGLLLLYLLCLLFWEKTASWADAFFMLLGSWMNCECKRFLFYFSYFFSEKMEIYLLWFVSWISSHSNLLDYPTVLSRVVKRM